MKLKHGGETTNIRTYATPAAGGIIYSLSVFFYNFWQARTDSILQISLNRQVWVVRIYLNIDAKYLFKNFIQ